MCYNASMIICILTMKLIWNYDETDLTREEIEKIRAEGLSEEDYNRIKKVVWGNYIRSHNAVEDYAGTFLQLHFMGIDYFDYYDVYKTVTFEDVKKRFETHFIKENSLRSFACVVDKNADSIAKSEFKNGDVLIIGNEANGLTEKVKTSADFLVTIPMNGKAESLNAAAAASIAMWEMMKV